MNSMTIDMAPIYLLVILTLLWASVSAQGNNEQKKHFEFTRIDEVQPGEVICNIPQKAQFNYPSDVLFSLRYEIVKGDEKDYFEVDYVQGILKVSTLLDRDVVCPHSSVCDILLDVAVVQPRDKFEIIKVTLTLTDANDNDPAFPHSEMTLRISENAAPPVSFVLPSAVDPDSGLNSVQSYDLSSEWPAFGLLTTDDGSGLSDVRLELKERLDREEEDRYDVYVIARDGGQPSRSGTMTVHVVVMDANDNSPTFELSLYNVSLLENHPLHTPFLQVMATDSDDGINGQIVYSVSPQTVQSSGSKPKFGINNVTGEVFLVDALDYEKESTHHLLVAAQDLGPDSVPAHAKIIVHVQDVNDFIPEIHINYWSSTGDIEVQENAQPGTFVAHVSVEDRDLGPSGTVTCHVADRRYSLEKMYSNTYKIITTLVLDREEQDHMVVSVTCQDQGIPPLSASRNITVHVVDENDHAPSFAMDTYVVRVPETSPIGYYMLKVHATDLDIENNAQITYHLHANSKHMVQVDQRTGVVTTDSLLDHETMDDIVFNILAIDDGKPPFSATATVSMIITDVNDEAPRFAQTSYNFGAYENEEPGLEIGQLAASDQDSPPNDQFEFDLDDNKAFAIDPDTGIITTKRRLDREHQAAYLLVAYARDTQPPYLSGSASVTIYVADKNDNAPGIISPKGDNTTEEVSAFAPVGYIIAHVRAVDADQQESDNAKLRYSIAKGNEAGLFFIDENSGIISLSKYLADTTQDAFPLVIMVQDSGENVKEAVTSLTILVNRTEAFARHIDLSSVINVTLPTVPIPVVDTDNDQFRLKSQHVILIILGAITVVLVSILVTAIVCIKKRQRYRDRDSYKYMCKIDLANHISATQGTSGAGASEGAARRQSLSSMDENVDIEKGQFLQFDPRDSGIPAPSLPGSLSDVSNGSQVALQIALGNGGEPIDRNEMCQHDENPGYIARVHSPPVQSTRPSDKPVPIHNILNVMPGERDSDSTSGCSADMSTSDGSKGQFDANDQRPTTTNSLQKQLDGRKKPCPTHGKNVTFGDVTCHSPTRSRGYATCPLPQCAVNHRQRLQQQAQDARTLPVDDRYDDRTGCHGGASSLNLRKAQSQHSNPPNGRIHPQPPVVLTTFGYDEAHRRRQANGNSSNDPETRSLLSDSRIVHSVDV